MPPVRLRPGDPVNDRTPVRPLLLTLLGITWLLAPAHAPAARAPAQPADPSSFDADTSRIEADENQQWMVRFNIHNRLGVGMYADSLSCTVEDLDPGETRGERVRVVDVSNFISGLSVSANDVDAFNFAAPATAEHARLTFRFVFSR